MLRLWQSEGVITLKKEKSSAMRADVLSKAMAPAAAFHRCARLLLTGSAEFGDKLLFSSGVVVALRIALCLGPLPRSFLLDFSLHRRGEAGGMISHPVTGLA